jgi:tRNA(His) guanylyltransferase
MNNKRDSLGDRMKSYYEDVYRIKLTHRTPVIIRLDGKAFHTLTRRCNRPFDTDFMTAMQLAALELIKQIQGAKIAYIQSDEVSILLTDFDKLDTSAWFDYNLQKMVSVSASIMTYYFNKCIEITANDRINSVGFFDARAFNIPESEVCNMFLWRQKDAERNSLSMLAQSLYSHRELQHKKSNDLQELCFQAGHNWNDLDTYKKRGSCIVYKNQSWQIDWEIPIFSQDRQYIEQYLVKSEG